MSSKGYSKFTDEDDEDDDTTFEEKSSSPVVPGTQSSIQNDGGLDYQEIDLNASKNDSTGGGHGGGDGDWDGDRGGGGGGGGGGSGIGGDGPTSDAGGGGNETDVETRSRDVSWAEFMRLLKSNAFLLYSSQVLSAWGDRMWTFAVALYLVEIEESSLRLTAVYGLTVTFCTLVFGAAVGRWVDRTPRLRAARTSLIIQNSTVMVNAGVLCTVLVLKQDILPIWDGALYIICQLIIILLGTISALASLAELICIQKDWVVVVAGNDKKVLTTLNANMRRIDLLVNILAPIVVGQIMTFGSMLIGGIFIAAWNAVSMIVEYWNLLRVYKNVPGLAIKDGLEFTDANLNQQRDANTATEMGDVASIDGSAEHCQENDESEKEARQEQVITEIPPTMISDPSTSNGCAQCCHKFAAKLKDMFDGWKVFYSYQERWAGLSLAFLYMTVMGFDSVTNGYGYSQGVPEWALGLLRGLGSISGLIGTLLFTFMNKRIGLVRSGLYALGIEVSFLMLCLASIWAPGSPFIYDYSSDVGTSQKNLVVAGNGSLVGMFTEPPESGLMQVTTEWMNSTAGLTTAPAVDQPGVQCKFTGEDGQQTSFWSIGLFFAGMVLSRMGLWSFDLVVTQLIQESVKEMERGVFNGVQRALECCFDMLHFILVIILPCPETFGYLIIVSIIFILAGLVCYMSYSYRRRGHLIHKEKFVPCLQNGHS